MEQKVVRIGNSIGVIIPQLLNRDIGLKPGDQLLVEKQGERFILSPLKKKKKNIAQGVNARFFKMVDEFMTEHEDVLKELARH